MAPHLGHEAHLDVVALEKLHPKEEHFWRKLNSVPFDSWSEKRLQVKVGLSEAELTGVGLGRLKCILPGANGKTGRSSSKAHTAFVLRSEGLSMAMFPQRCVGTSVCHRWPDSLVVAAMNGKRQTAVIEIDGDSFHRDTAKDARRSRELDVPVLRIAADEVGHPDIVERILSWLRSLFSESRGSGGDVSHRRSL